MTLRKFLWPNAVSLNNFFIICFLKMVSLFLWWIVFWILSLFKILFFERAIFFHDSDIYMFWFELLECPPIL